MNFTNKQLEGTSRKKQLKGTAVIFSETMCMRRRLMTSVISDPELSLERIQQKKIQLNERLDWSEELMLDFKYSNGACWLE
jgi:hypothetical protein